MFEPCDRRLGRFFGWQLTFFMMMTILKYYKYAFYIMKIYTCWLFNSIEESVVRKFLSETEF